MAYTVYSAAQAKARAEDVTRYQTGMCLGFTRQCLNGEKGVGLYDANAAWTAAKQKETTGVPPAGAPVYFKGGAHGHIVISLGGGKVRSTDYQTGYGFRAGYVGTATINEVALEFFGTTSAYRGWSRDYAGLVIRGLEETTTNYSPPPVIPEEDDLPTPAEVWNYLITSPNDPDYKTTAYSWLRGATVYANDAKKLAADAVNKVNALGSRQELINDVRDAILNAPVQNHDPNPDDNVPADSAAFRSYSVMANFRAADLQGKVATLGSDVAAIKGAQAGLETKLDEVLKAIAALPKG